MNDQVGNLNDDDDDDDIHHCNLCQASLHGLDNYVIHRRNKLCPKLKTDPNKSNNPAKEGLEMLETTSFVQEPMPICQAEDFFQSLELKQKPASNQSRCNVESETNETNNVPLIGGFIPLFKDCQNRESEFWSGDINFPESPPDPKNAKANPQSLLSYMKPTGSSKSKVKDVLLAPVHPAQNQNDFMRRMNLMNVTTVGVEPESDHLASNIAPSGVRFRLWQPETENGPPFGTGGAMDEDVLWRDVLPDDVIGMDHSCNDPTLMEEVVVLNGPEDGDHLYNQSCQKQLSSQENLLNSNIVTTSPRKRIANRRYLDDNNDISMDGICDSKACFSASSSSQISMATNDVIQCQGCSAQVNANQFGKHLISHFHHHRSKLRKNDPINRALILEHIHDVTKLAPFQCEPCGFYCNWDHEFVAHWNSDFHRQSQSSDSFEYWCSFCNVSSKSSEVMGDHLQGEKHHEIVVAISRCVPIKIRKVLLSSCSICSEKFRLKFALKRHMILEHKQKKFRFHDHELFQCEHCPFENYSFRSVQSHKFLAHPEKRSKYHCRICCIQFHSKSVCEKHRKSLEHRWKAKERSQGHMKSVQCDFCLLALSDLMALKTHIKVSHSDRMSQCGLCGQKFALAQELGAHVKTQCQIQGEISTGNLLCGENGCQFSCDSLNMVLFHQSLLHGHERDENGRYRCSLCDKYFIRSKLWEHIRIHGESHRCGECYRIFKTKSNLVRHQEQSGHGKVTKGSQKLFCRQCSYTARSAKLLQLHEKRSHFQAKSCPECGLLIKTYSGYFHHLKSHSSSPIIYKCEACAYIGQSSSDLKKHGLTHVERLDLECSFCDYKCKRSSELNRHVLRKHSRKGGDNFFRCDMCDYKSLSQQHLRRHVQTIHEGSVKFQCRLCDHSCSTEENLRKHILKTNKHPNASVYNCQVCSFATNAKIDYKSHLTSLHSDSFPDAFSVSRHVKLYFQPVSEFK